MFRPLGAVARSLALGLSLAAPSLLVTTDAPFAATALHGAARMGGGGGGFHGGGFSAPRLGPAGRSFAGRSSHGYRQRYVGGHRTRAGTHTGGRHGPAHPSVARHEQPRGQKAYRPSHAALTPSRPTGQPSVRQGAGSAATGWSGQTFWPDASRDLFGYTFRPRAGDASVWDYAYDDVFTGIFWPPNQPSTESREQPANTGSVSKPSPGSDAARGCADRAPGVTDWPFGRIEEMLQPAGAQRTAFDALKAAVTEAMAALRANCAAQAPDTPVERLQAIEQRIGVMIEAIRKVRPALASFYAALSEEQKSQFDAMGVPNESANNREGLIASLGRGERNGSVGGCGGERVVGYRDRTIHQIDKVVRPMDAQRGALDDLRAAASQAADAVRASCAGEQPGNPAARLDAIGKKLDAMLQAVRTIRPALEKFYGLLSDEQKARFNAMSTRNG